MLAPTVTCMFKSPVCRARVSGRSVLYAVTGLVMVALLVAAVVAGNVVWNGAPYPSADPNAVAQRLKARSDEVYMRLRAARKVRRGLGQGRYRRLLLPRAEEHRPH